MTHLARKMTLVRLTVATLALTLPGALSGCVISDVKCYIDDDKRVLNDNQAPDGPVTQEWCASYCHEQQMPLAGVEYGDQCFCGSKVRDDAQPAAAGDCSMACSASADETCGGSYRIGVFAVNCSGAPLPRPTPPPMLNNPCLNETSDFAKQPWCDHTLPIDERVKDMVSRLTLAEKIQALDTDQPALRSLGLNPYNWWSEATHGISHVRNDDTTPYESNTAFPITTAMSFNRSLWKATGNLIGREARAFMNAGNAWSTYWAPVINLAREPRWGRNIETPGEDPFLTGEYATQFVKGFETNEDDPKYLQASACCKHYVANSMEDSTVAGERHQRYEFNANVTDQDLVDSYLLPFQACVEKGQVSSLMCSYNAVNGVPSCANDWLLQTVARDAWGFDGYITSDCDADANVYNAHHYTATPEEAVAAVLHAGTDVDCTNFVGQHAQTALDKKLITEADIDVRLAFLFRVRMRLAHFDPPSAMSKIPPTAVCTDANREVARDGVRQSVALLKNAGGVLPLAKTLKSLAVLGPTANLSTAISGYYGGNNCDADYPNMVDALAEVVVDTRTALGVPDVKSTDTSGVAAAAALAKAADAVVLCLGTDLSWGREGMDAVNISFSEGQLALLAAVTAAVDTPIVVVTLTATPLDLTPLLSNAKVGAIVHLGQPSVQTRGAADVLFGAASPAGKSIQTVYPAAYQNDISIFDFNMRPGPSAWPRPDCEGPAASCPRGTNPGRTYRFYTGEAVLPFGFGLSYTTFTYAVDTAVSAPQTLSLAPLRELLHATYRATGTHFPRLRDVPTAASYCVHVTNTGSVDADDVVLGFLTPPGAGQGGVPLKTLFGFERVHVKAGQTVSVWLYPSLTDFAFANARGERTPLPGAYAVSFGVRQATAHGMGYAEVALEARLEP